MKIFILSCTILVFVLFMNYSLCASHSVKNDDSLYYLDTSKTNFPKMELLLGDVRNGQKIDPSNLTLNLQAIVGEISPKKSIIQIEQWIVSIDGCKIPFSGSGNTLSKEVIKEIKQTKEGSKITISVIYGMTDSKTHRPTTSTFLANPKTTKN